MAKTLASTNHGEEILPEERKVNGILGNGNFSSTCTSNLEGKQSSDAYLEKHIVSSGKDDTLEEIEESRSRSQEISAQKQVPLASMSTAVASRQEGDIEMGSSDSSNTQPHPRESDVEKTGASTSTTAISERGFRDPKTTPLVSLSVNLIKTYKHINEVYYAEKRKRQAAASNATTGTAKVSSGKTLNNGYDDENYDYIIQLNERLDGRYVVKQRIGRGSFGQVVRAHDMHTKKDVAIKIIKSRKPFFNQAKTEIELLQKLNESDPDDQWFMVRLLGTFCHHRHQCLVFEMLSHNLYDLLRNTKYQGVSLNLIKKFASQLLKALYHLSRKEIDIIHCDLKPENILLRNPKRSAIKVIDFGSSCRSDKKIYSYIQSRFYRSPEVILGLPYTAAIDIWSVGCILVEMHTGEPLFSGADEHDQMIRLVAVLGMPPQHMLELGTKVSKFFQHTVSDDGKDVYRLKPRKCATAEEEIAAHSRSLETVLGTDGSGPQGRRKDDPAHSPSVYALFLDLIKRMLEFDPKRRIKPTEALRHAYFKEAFQQSNTGVVQGANASNRAHASTNSASLPNPSVTSRPFVEQLKDTPNSVRSNINGSAQVPWPSPYANVVGGGLGQVHHSSKSRRAKRPGSAPAKTHQL